MLNLCRTEQGTEQGTVTNFVELTIDTIDYVPGIILLTQQCCFLCIVAIEGNNA
jgi:hypothetical protein